MWEISVNFFKEDYAINFKNNIKCFIKNIDGITTLLVTDNVYSVLIGVPNEFKEKANIFLKEKIAETILLNFKKDFILTRLNFKTKNESKMNVFLKALVCFDMDIDKEIIISKIDKFKNKFFLESFIDFKLSFLKRKWKELVDLANDNAIYMFQEDSFNELIKFLISNLENRISCVNIFSKKDCYFLCDYNGKGINDFLIDNYIIYDDDSLITSLIALNPEKIVMHTKSLVKDSVLKTLYLFFATRIEIFN